jgi:predicted acyltransferase
MVLANFMGGILVIPAWLKHTPDVGLTFIDLIAPFFIFAISLTYGQSFQRRLQREGSFKAYSQFFTRYLAIIGLGALVSAGETAFGLNSNGIEWGVLQAIGAAGLVALIVIRLPSTWRWGIGLSLLLIYQIVLDRFWLDIVIRSPHGGFFGSLGWSSMLILGTALANLFHGDFRAKKAFPWVAMAILVAGVALAFLLPISKHRVSASYVLTTLGISALLFVVFNWFNVHFKRRGHFLVAWGKNPLILYFLHYIFIGFVFVPGYPFLYINAPLWMVLLEIAGLVGGISIVAYWLDRRNIIIAL